MRGDATRLLDMLIAARRVEQFTSGMARAAFAQSELHQSAVIRELQVIGEAARLVSEDAKAATPQIPWAEIAGMRNRMVHEYFRVSIDVVWNVVEGEIVPLIVALEDLVPLEDDDQEPES